MAKRIALVLGSGGARGYAHIGVIDEVVARGYEVIAIAGCSMGAVIGGVYSTGQLENYRDWVCQLDYFDVLKLVDVTWNAMGAIRAGKVMGKLKELVGDVQIEDLPVPLTTVATDLTRQREVWFQSGPLLRAIRASIAVPGVITPLRIGDQILVDGGLLNPLPIVPTVSAHADLILAVNATAQSHQPVTLEELLPPDEAAEEHAREAELEAQGKGFTGWVGGMRNRAQRMFTPNENGLESEAETTNGEMDRQRATERAWSKLDIMLASFEITQAALAKYKIAGYPPDVLVDIPKTVCGAYEFHRAEGLIRLGRHLAAQALDRYEGKNAGGQSIISEPPVGKPAN
ncbi:NTE family protein [Modicisalibacter xianhensis]|uniref:NTE family protein n=1 Tax=Modicisalibacter xianhensis TaxID=442341 RepID=A0A4V3GUL2_9GAMM|nr:patatin-like phospholipase family protein [Halomonas xianhensis]TDX30491.1 NTE family protein [Halomonas xianhensis]